jgi:acetyl-CoA carboxylase carboxyl transferase subunit alpha
LIDCIVEEPTGGAHRAHQAMAKNLAEALQNALQKLAPVPTRDLLKTRLERLMAYGRVKELARR